MREAYATQADSFALKLRWISVQCYEIIFPGGKTLVTDPFYLDKKQFQGIAEEDLTPNQKIEKNIYAQSGFSVDQFTGADYILLNHVHGDHCNLIGELWNRFYGRILVPADCAEEVAKVFDIPYAAIYPLYPGNTYYFEDFTLKVYPGAHDNRSFREGVFQRPSDSRTLYDGSEGFGLPCPCRLGPLGSMFNFNYIIETKNNYRIDFSAGRDYEEHCHHVQNEKPNLMLRHRIRSYSPETFADMIEQMGAQLALPLHHNNAQASGEDLNAYFNQVNEILRRRGNPARAFNPKPYHWYQIHTSIVSE
ncbi:MAG: MBL fold metallo-hydrolase [Clostridium sp.]|nr:MBL fold metallo-hydrolase [Clostridium sp.]